MSSRTRAAQDSSSLAAYQMRMPVAVIEQQMAGLMQRLQLRHVHHVAALSHRAGGDKHTGRPAMTLEQGHCVVMGYCDRRRQR